MSRVEPLVDKRFPPTPGVRDAIRRVTAPDETAQRGNVSRAGGRKVAPACDGMGPRKRSEADEGRL